ncbi:MAG: nicotinamide mononucleotide transporter [Bacteroidetes bacterium]|nr:nicotinamide mononucleotide transporter [Bacteroidota bacterium]
MNISEIFSSIRETLFQTSILEWAIFVAALGYVILATFENKWCWVFGIASSAMLVYLCFTGHLFLESGLNVFYVLIGFYGWYQWLYGSREKSELTITSFSLKKNIVLILIGLIFWFPLGFISHRYSTQALPYLDAFITAFSIIATWMQAKKIIENWLFWILLNGLGILLYSYRGFYLIALLSIIYTLLSVSGYFSWRKRILK